MSRRGEANLKGWKTRNERKRERDRQIVDALKAARKIIRGELKVHRQGHTIRGRFADEEAAKHGADLQTVLAKISQALWRFGVHK